LKNVNPVGVVFWLRGKKDCPLELLLAVKPAIPLENGWIGKTGLFSEALFSLTLSSFFLSKTTFPALPKREFLLSTIFTELFCYETFSDRLWAKSEPGGVDSFFSGTFAKSDACCEVNNPGDWLFFSSFLFVSALKGAGASGFLENKEGNGLFLLA